MNPDTATGANDLIRQGGQPPARAAWQVRAFVGTGWQVMRREAAIAYQVNTYRVLLTRARYETVIWVPQGEAADRTRDPASFDAIARFLAECGARTAEETEMQEIGTQERPTASIDAPAGTLL